MSEEPEVVEVEAVTPPVMEDYKQQLRERLEKLEEGRSKVVEQRG